ncbi:MAG: hypothetical protein ABR508_10690 [Candidatus Baltobacteraceae bacterium]
MHHPLLCSNLVDVKNRPLPFVREIAIPSSAANVHFTGLLVRQYAPHSPWENLFGWRFLEPFAVTAEAAARVPDGEPFVVLSHLGLSLDRKLARAVPRITLLLGGHSHDTLEQPEVVNGVPIVHAGPYGAFVSRSDLQVENGRWGLHDFSLLPLRP